MADPWTQTTIAGKRADTFAPARPPRFGVIFLHDLDRQTLAEKPVFTRLLAERNLACVCPHGQRSWWADRICAEFDPAVSAERYVLENVVPFFQERFRLAPKAIGLLGIGMGGQGALRLAFKHPHLFSTAAAIAPALDFHDRYGQGTPLDEMYDSKEQCRQDTALLHVPPHHPPPHLYFAINPDDPWHPGCDRLHEKLSALGVEHTFEISPDDGGHTWGYFDKMAGRAVSFLVEGLDQESRRLL
jgi:S-formylglutathione hydrolase FrmB